MSEATLFGDAFLLMLALFFLPVVLAFVRGHRNALAITAVTILLGWSVVGWIWALIWSLTDNTRPKERKKIW